MAEPLPEDVLAERDAEQRAGERRSPPVEATAPLPDDVRAELDRDARLTTEPALRPTDEEIVPIDDDL
jgi:hypothetical protein